MSPVGQVVLEVVETVALLVLVAGSTWQDWVHRTYCQHRQGSIHPLVVGNTVVHRGCDRHRDSFGAEEQCTLHFGPVAVVHIVVPDSVAAVDLETPFARTSVQLAARLPWAVDCCSLLGGGVGHRRGC